jgi:ABC-type Fe3+ transport system permease subunit
MSESPLDYRDARDDARAARPGWGSIVISAGCCLVCACIAAAFGVLAVLTAWEIVTEREWNSGAAWRTVFYSALITLVCGFVALYAGAYAASLWKRKRE